MRTTLSLHRIKEPSWVIQFMGDRGEVVVPLNDLALVDGKMIGRDNRPDGAWLVVDVLRPEYTVWMVEEDGDNLRATLVVDRGQEVARKNTETQ